MVDELRWVLGKGHANRLIRARRGGDSARVAWEWFGMKENGLIAVGKGMVMLPLEREWSYCRWKENAKQDTVLCLARRCFK